MTLIADILLIAGALGAAFYCIVLSRRLTRFTDLEKGVGGAIAVLSAQVDDMTKTLELARDTASGSTASLNDLTGRAEGVAKRLELLVASMHDLPQDPAPERQRTNDPEAQASAASASQTAPGAAAAPEAAAPETASAEPESGAPEGTLFLSHRTRAREASP